ncbi:MAG: hypothetical protein ACF788_04550 [Novipirellula sp. JB048]
MFSKINSRARRRVARGISSRRTSKRRLFHERLEDRRLLAVVGIKDPGFSFVDVNNDGFYDMGSDIELPAGVLEDGFFDAQLDEPGYTAPGAGAGLVINGIAGAAISSGNLDFSADGQIIVNTNLTATTNNLLLTSRDSSVLLDDPTLQAKNLLELTAAEDIISEDDVLLGTGPSSVIHLDAGRDVMLTGTRVEAKKTVDIDAANDIHIMPSVANDAIVKATPNALGKVDLQADETINIDDANIEARKDIVMESKTLMAIDSMLTANGHGLAKIDLHGLDTTDVSRSEILARKTVMIETYSVLGGGLIAVGSKIETAIGGATTVHLESDGLLDIQYATVRATSEVTILAHNSGLVDMKNATVEANVTGNGTVDVSGGEIDVRDGTVAAKKDVIFNAMGKLLGTKSDIQATAPQLGNITMKATDEINFFNADIKAGIGIDIQGDTKVFIQQSRLLACGKPASTVKISAGSDLHLNVGTVIRAGRLIDLLTPAFLNLQNSSFGIWYQGVGDIVATANFISQGNAELKAPDDLTRTAPTIVGIPFDDTPGTLSCDDLDTPPVP